MEALKSKAVLIAAASVAVFSLGYYLLNKSTVQKTKKTEPLQDASTLKHHYDQIFENRVVKFQAQQTLSNQNIVLVFRYLAASTQNLIRNFERSNLNTIRELKGKHFDEFLLTLLTSLKAQGEQISQILKQKRDVLSFLNIRVEQIPQDLEIQLKINEYFYKNIDEDHYKLAKSSILEKVSYLDSNGKQMIAKINKATSLWAQSDLEYVPFILNLMVTEEVYSSNQQLNDKSSEIYWATTKYAERLQMILVAWERTVELLLETPASRS